MNKKREQIIICIENYSPLSLFAISKRFAVANRLSGWVGGCKQQSETNFLQKKAQISTEYIIVVSFVFFFVLTALGIGLTYSTQIKDSLKFNQIENFAEKLTSSAETVFYSGAPARTTIKGYLPEGIENIQILDYYVVFTVQSGSGTSVSAYKSNVNMSGAISPNSGVRVIYLNASTNSVIISG